LSTIAVVRALPAPAIRLASRPRAAG